MMKWTIAVAMLALLVIAGALFLMIRSGGTEEHTEEKAGSASETEIGRKPVVIETVNMDLDLSGIYSDSGIVVRLSDGKVITGFQEEERIYPASLTKMMTCLIGIELIEDRSEEVILEKEIFRPLYEEGASMAGFLPGETVAAEDLLYGIILPSGGECSVQIARHTAGSEEAFVELMNEKASELGMENTHFTNVTGLHDEDHYTTVEDMAALLRYALKDRTFRTIFCTEKYTASPTEEHPEGLTFQSSMFRLREDWKVPGGEVRGGKTGFTDQSGLCLASLAHVDNRDYIIVTAKADGNHQTEPYHVLDALNLYGQLRKGWGGSDTGV